MKTMIVLVRESDTLVEYYMNGELFFAHVKKKVYLSDPEGLPKIDLRREVAERVMFCVLANLGYEMQFNFI